MAPGSGVAGDAALDTAAPPPPRGRCDRHATAPGVVAAIMVADCIPVLFCDRDGHAGRGRARRLARPGRGGAGEDGRGIGGARRHGLLAWLGPGDRARRVRGRRRGARRVPGRRGRPGTRAAPTPAVARAAARSSPVVATAGCATSRARAGSAAGARGRCRSRRGHGARPPIRPGSSRTGATRRGPGGWRRWSGSSRRPAVMLECNA